MLEPSRGRYFSANEHRFRTGASQLQTQRLVISCAYAYLNTYIAPGANNRPPRPSPSLPKFSFSFQILLFRIFARIILLPSHDDHHVHILSSIEATNLLENIAIISNHINLYIADTSFSTRYFEPSYSSKIENYCSSPGGQLDDITKWNNYPTRGRPSSLGRSHASDGEINSCQDK